MAGRPSKINQPIVTDDGEEITVAEAIVRALEVGAYVENAAEAAGVSARVVFDWLARGQEHSNGECPKSERRYVQFLQAATRARARRVIFALDNTRRAAKDDWRADAWYLERGHADRYGRRLVEAHHSGRVEHDHDLSIDLEDEATREAAHDLLQRLTD